jgi:DnaD/phage-associated family protein
MKNMPWFRLYSDVLTDRKINRICKNTGQAKAIVIGVWVCLLSLANESPKRGVLMLADDIAYTLDDLEDETGMPREIIGQLIDEFRAHGMVAGQTIIQIANWDKRQYQSDNSTERVRRFREKQQQDETFLKRFSNALDTEKDTESDTDAKKKQTTTTTTSSSGGSGFDAEYSVLARHYERNIGPLTPIISEQIGDDLKEYGLTCCMDAIGEAARQNVRKWSYVQGVLKGMARNGRTPQKRNGKVQPAEAMAIILPNYGEET